MRHDTTLLENKTGCWKKENNATIHIQPEKRSHPQGHKSFEMVCCVFCPPYRPLRKTSIKLKAHVLETIKMVKRAVKNLPAHDKTEEKEV